MSISKSFLTWIPTSEESISRRTNCVHLYWIFYTIIGYYSISRTSWDYFLWHKFSFLLETSNIFLHCNLHCKQNALASNYGTVLTDIDQLCINIFTHIICIPMLFFCILIFTHILYNSSWCCCWSSAHIVQLDSYHRLGLAHDVCSSFCLVNGHFLIFSSDASKNVYILTLKWF